MESTPSTCIVGLEQYMTGGTVQNQINIDGETRIHSFYFHLREIMVEDVSCVM